MPLIPFSSVRHWMFDQALPVWAERGVDRAEGGFLEELSLSGEATNCDYKRVRTICRQTYVFSHAALSGWKEGEALSRLGYEYLIAHAKLADGAWARRLSRDGRVIDPTPDLYDLAFVIFAMAWRYRVSGDDGARAEANAALRFVRERMAGPHGGFWHVLPPSGPRLQNPHMHLAEACLAAFEATRDEIYLETANAAVDLLVQRLFDGVSLGERFRDDWRRLPGELEPGHHFEWAWILGRRAKIAGVNAAGDVMLRLLDYAERQGVDPASAAVYDAVGDDGAATRTSSRVWPNTERIKGHLAAFEMAGRDPAPAVASSLKLIFERYFAPPAAPGLWTDQFDGEGRPLAKAVPASCVYHLFLAFSEVLRLQPEIEAGGHSARQT